MAQSGLRWRLGRRREASRAESGKFRDGLDIDVERVEKKPAVRRIRAGGVSVLIKQRMQRIERNAGGTELGRKGEQARQIGEVAMAPIAPRAHAIELRGQRPQTMG